MKDEGKTSTADDEVGTCACTPNPLCPSHGERADDKGGCECVGNLAEVHTCSPRDPVASTGEKASEKEDVKPDEAKATSPEAPEGEESGA